MIKYYKRHGFKNELKIPQGTIRKLVDGSKRTQPISKVNPYRFEILPWGDWRIGFGISNFLVAEGSSWSIAVGRKLYRELQSGNYK